MTTSARPRPKIEGGQFSVSGEAEGAFADKPNQRVSATFDIKTAC